MKSPELSGFELDDSEVDDTPGTSTSGIDDPDSLPPAMFPRQLKYMDLSVLELHYPPRVPQLMLIRNEWANITKILDEREEGILGSAIITGQPGTGQ
jgi:hypothetical protein